MQAMQICVEKFFTNTEVAISKSTRLTVLAESQVSEEQASG